MSKGFLNRNYQNNTDSNNNAIPQKKIDPVAQQNWLNNSKVDEGWGVFNNNSDGNNTAQMQSQDEKPGEKGSNNKKEPTNDFIVPTIVGGIETTAQATWHYFNGKGIAVSLGNDTINTLLNREDFLTRHNRIVSGKTTRLTGHFSVDMTSEVFHVGRTNVKYSISIIGDVCTVTYELFANDGFWDVDFVDEKTLGKMGFKKYQPDGPGPNLERMGGTPYAYVPVTVTSTFPNPGY